MLYFDGVFGLALMALWLFCIFDVITTDASRCRNLPKMAWLVIVVVLFEIGALAWLVAGRTWNGNGRDLPYKGNTGRFPEYDRPGRHIATNPDDDEAFLQGLRDRAEQQRRAARSQRETGSPSEADLGGEAGPPGGADPRGEAGPWPDARDRSGEEPGSSAR